MCSRNHTQDREWTSRKDTSRRPCSLFKSVQCVPTRLVEKPRTVIPGAPESPIMYEITQKISLYHTLTALFQRPLLSEVKSIFLQGVETTKHPKKSYRGRPCALALSADKRSQGTFLAGSIFTKVFQDGRRLQPGGSLETREELALGERLAQDEVVVDTEKRVSAPIRCQKGRLSEESVALREEV